MSTVVITGASRGLGLEFVRQYAADGWAVHACCRTPGDIDAGAIGGEITVHEQNAGGVRSVASNMLYFTTRQLPPQVIRRGGNTETRTTRVTVSGSYRIFRPQPRE